MFRSDGRPGPPGPGGTDNRKLGIAKLGVLKEHPRITRFRNFIQGWYLSYFSPDAARSLPRVGPQKHLSIQGDNLGNVVQFMEREHRKELDEILSRISRRIPGVRGIDTTRTEDGRLLLRFNDSGFRDQWRVCFEWQSGNCRGVEMVDYH